MKSFAGIRMRIGWSAVFQEIVKVTLFFAAGAALLVGMLNFH
ncbi:MAG TPA: hypothetical protein VGQ99_10255 [Tepidisphaeraceae bacterium]|jgi:hypothetical protein|nr:hypothetical protein [Tepidisphaeraceae bacterium]